MGENLRPVKLNRVVLGYSCQDGWSEFLFDLSLCYKLAQVILKYADEKPTLVFCSSRKGVIQAANTLLKSAKFVRSAQHKQQLIQSANTLRDNKLRDVVVNGIGFHHAGLEPSDKKSIEELFVTASLPVLISTTTLALGVNFPAHLVIIKGTAHYDAGAYVQYSDMQILQMIGRAGRPQFDTSATAVIMTKNNLKAKYQSFVDGNQMVESSLHKHLIEHLNAEIVLQTISDVSIAMEWIKSTYFYIRVMKNPKHYGISSDLTEEQKEKKLVDLCVKELNGLAKYKLIFMDNDCFDLKPLDPGRLMARYYITFDTMKRFTTLQGNEHIKNLVELLSGCREFHDIQLRLNDKKALNLMNKSRDSQTIRYPMVGKIKNSGMKVNCLIQATFGCLPIHEFTFNHESNTIMRNGQRLAKCLAEYLSFEAKGFRSLLNAVLLSKCFRAKLWENSKHVARQLEKIGVTLSSALVSAGIHSFQHIEDANPRELEMIVNRHPPFGTQLRDAVIHLPKYDMTVKQQCQWANKTANLCIDVQIINCEQLEEKRTAPGNHSCLLIVGDADNNILLRQRLFDSVLLRKGHWTNKVELARPKRSDEISLNLISEYYVGLDIQKTFTPAFMGQKRQQNIPLATQPLKRPKYGIEDEQEPTPPPSRSLADAGGNWRECHHHCHNKATCGHECCKKGCHGQEVHEKKPKQPIRIERELEEIGNKFARLMPETSKRPLLGTRKSSSVADITDLEKKFSYLPRHQKMERKDPITEACHPSEKRFLVGRNSLSSRPNFNMEFDWEDHTESKMNLNELNQISQASTTASSDCVVVTEESDADLLSCCKGGTTRSSWLLQRCEKHSSLNVHEMPNDSSQEEDFLMTPPSNLRLQTLPTIQGNSKEIIWLKGAIKVQNNCHNGREGNSMCRNTSYTPRRAIFNFRIHR